MREGWGGGGKIAQASNSTPKYCVCPWWPVSHACPVICIRGYSPRIINQSIKTTHIVPSHSTIILDRIGSVFRGGGSMPPPQLPKCKFSTKNWESWMMKIPYSPFFLQNWLLSTPLTFFTWNKSNSLSFQLSYKRISHYSESVLIIYNLSPIS